MESETAERGKIFLMCFYFYTNACALSIIVHFHLSGWFLSYQQWLFSGGKCPSMSKAHVLSHLFKPGFALDIFNCCFSAH